MPAITELNASLIHLPKPDRVREASGCDVDVRSAEAVTWLRCYAEGTALGNEIVGWSSRCHWTDAVALETWLGLASSTREATFLEEAFQLIEDAHPSALALCKAAGGVRAPSRLERWLRALDRVTRVTGDPIWSRLAVELAPNLLRGHLHSAIYWRESRGVEREFRAAFGDASERLLEAYVTLVQLEATARLTGDPGRDDLAELADDFAETLPESFSTPTEPLSIGWRLLSSSHLLELLVQGARLRLGLIEALLSSAMRGLGALADRGHEAGASPTCPAFRELTLALGVQTFQAMGFDGALPDGELGPVARGTVERCDRLGRQLLSYWRDGRHQRGPGWTVCYPTNVVMLAAALHPRGCVELPPPPAGRSSADSDCG